MHGVPQGVEAVVPDRPPGATFADLTIIVPTLNEAETVPLLLAKLAREYPQARVIIADDDSADGTREVAGAFDGDLAVRVLHRTAPAVKGLTGSVVDALRLVETPYFIVMDADLQHPPEAVAEVYRHASNGVHFAVGRRINDASFTTGRRVISRGARVLTRAYLRSKGKPVVADPMSGFFGGKTAYAAKILESHENKFEKKGFKVLVDFLRFAPPATKVHEVPYSFGSRAAGTSKLSVSHTLSLLRQLGLPGRAVAAALSSVLLPSFRKFAAVGASGVLVNMGLLLLLHGLLAVPLLPAALLAVEGSILWNFFWNDRWSFAGRGRATPVSRRLARFHLQSAAGAAANVLVLAGLAALGLHYALAHLSGIAVAVTWNWLLSHHWTWSDDPVAG